jgi:hypothetical protein
MQLLGGAGRDAATKVHLTALLADRYRRGFVAVGGIGVVTDPADANELGVEPASRF